MNQQPDKFFRDKLHGYEKSISSEAWNRIAQNLDQKKGRGLWVKVAAAIALLATTGILLYPALRSDNTIAITEKITPAPVDERATVTSPPAIADTTQPAEKNDAQQTNKTTLHPQQPIHRNKLQRKKSATAPDEGLQIPEVASADIQPVEKPKEDEPVVATTSTEEKVIEQSSGVTIVFSTEEVNKYLTKNEDIDATSHDKSSSTFKKLLDKAYDLKHNQDPLGGLRQKKNEILAMNFRNEKERTQND
jgi:hypothetical protein